MPGLADDISDTQLSPTTPRQQDESGAAFEPQTGAKQVAPTREMPAGTSSVPRYHTVPQPLAVAHDQLRLLEHDLDQVSPTTPSASYLCTQSGATPQVRSHAEGMLCVHALQADYAVRESLRPRESVSNPNGGESDGSVTPPAAKSQRGDGHGESGADADDVEMAAAGECSDAGDPLAR